MTKHRYLANVVVRTAGILAACVLLMGADECEQENCVPDFVDINSEQVLDGIECQHGPEHDDDCIDCLEWIGQEWVPSGLKPCCEYRVLSGGGAVSCKYFDENGTLVTGLIPKCDGTDGTMPVCDCLDCTAPEENGCEGRIFQWMATCGIFENQPTGECKSHIPEYAPRVVIKYQIPYVLNVGATCSGPAGSTNKMEKKYVCGSMPAIWYADCISQNACIPDPNYPGVDSNDPEECLRQYDTGGGGIMGKASCGKRAACGDA